MSHETKKKLSLGNKFCSAPNQPPQWRQPPWAACPTDRSRPSGTHPSAVQRAWSQASRGAEKVERNGAKPLVWCRFLEPWLLLHGGFAPLSLGFWGGDNEHPGLLINVGHLFWGTCKHPVLMFVFVYRFWGFDFAPKSSMFLVGCKTPSKSEKLKKKWLAK